MKLHTTLERHEIQSAFRDVRDIGHITVDVSMIQFDYEPSRTHPHGHKIQLGTFEQFSLPNGKSRRNKNTGKWGANSQMWAASYDEWGWFIARIFELDPTARWAGGGAYQSPDDFIKKTDGKYIMYLPNPHMWKLESHP